MLTSEAASSLPTAPHNAAAMIVAFPRNMLHVRLLQANCPDVDLVLYREKFLETILLECFGSKRIRYIGRERRPRFWLSELWACRQFNTAYYPKVMSQLPLKDRIGRFIIFHENEPLEWYLIDQIGIDRFELWEEGVMHYVNMYNPAAFRFRKLAQALAGFYPKHIFDLRMDRSTIKVRDRFTERNLHLPKPVGNGIPRAEVAFLANAVVQDNLISLPKYISALRELCRRSPLPVVYLPHPREDPEVLAKVKAALSECTLTFFNSPLGSLQHCADYDYSAYVSAFSTTLLDLQIPEKSIWIPALFGLSSYAQALKGTDVFPVHLVGEWETLEVLLTRLKRQQYEDTGLR